jgi:DNA (cytosine-5)-methyltransferase 1
MATMTAKGDTAIMAPIISTYYGPKTADEARGGSPDKPIGTRTAENRHSLVSAFMVKHYGEQFNGRKAVDAREPLPTITSRNTQNQLVSSHLTKLYGTCQHGQDQREPMPTITADGTHIGEVRAFLTKYYGASIGQDARDPMHTITAKHRMGLVTIEGEEYQITDIGMRMLSPRELYRAQGFPNDYIIDPIVNGKPLTKTAQVRMVGNSVSPPPAIAILAANFAHETEYVEVVA